MRTACRAAFLLAALASCAQAQEAEPFLEEEVGEEAIVPETPPEAPPGPPSPGPPAEEEPKPNLFRMGVLGGALLNMSSGAEEGGTALLRVWVQTPLMDVERYKRPVWLLAQLDLGALPGESLSFAQVETFRTLEFRAGLAWRPFDSIAVAIYGAGGYASRLANDPEPLDNAARWAEGGVRVANAGGDYLEVGIGPDERLDGDYQPVLSVNYGVEVYPRGSSDSKFTGRLVGRGLLALDFDEGNTLAPKDVIQIGIVVAR